MSGQRAVVSEEEREVSARLWRPEAPAPEPGERAPSQQAWKPRRDDVYVVVDDLDPDRVRLVLSVWPRLDRAGRLVFRLRTSDSRTQVAWRGVLRKLLATEERPSITTDAQPYEFLFSTDREGLQRAVDRGRARNKQLGADRELRIGDAFRVRGIRSGNVGKWEDILDITAQAREAARAALLAAVAPKVATDEAEAVDTTMTDEQTRRVSLRRRSPIATTASSSV